MTVKRVQRDADVFLITCDTKTCAASTHVKAGDMFQLARVAGRYGWTIGTRVRCKACPEATVKPKARKR